MRIGASLVYAAVVLLLGCTNGTEQSPGARPAESDRYPDWPTDGCSYWLRSSGVWLQFPSGSDAFYLRPQMEERLDALARTYAAERGVLLIESHMDSAEVAARGASNLDRRRAERVRAELALRGVRADDMWIRNYGAARPMVPTRPGVGDMNNRRVSVRLPMAGAICRSERRRERVEWFQRNCYPLPATARRQECNRALEDIRTGNVGSV